MITVVPGTNIYTIKKNPDSMTSTIGNKLNKYKQTKTKSQTN